MSDEVNKKTFEYYLRICEDKAPYPINYFPYGKDPRDQLLAMMVGMMIDKGYLKL